VQHDETTRNIATHLTPPERETVINTTDDDDLVEIWTAQRPYITRLRKNSKVTEIRSGHYGSTEWAEFSVPSDQWSPDGGVKYSRKQSDEQKRAAAERLAAARAARE
jgi:hypothetical protein